MAMTVLASNQGSGPVSVKQIAREKDLSASYLEQLLAPLRRAGLVRSVRGPQGGYLLAQPPETITVRDILEILEGPMIPIECSVEQGELDCCGEDECALRRVWVNLRESMIDVVESVTLSDLAEGADSVTIR